MEHSLIQVGAARHTLGSIMDELNDLPYSNTAACILFTLDVAAEEGWANFEIVNKALRAKKE